MRRQHIALNTDEDENNTSSNRSYEKRANKYKKEEEPTEEEEEEELIVSKKRKKEKKDATAISSSERNKRQTQFPNRFSVFALTSMRASMVVQEGKKKDKKDRLSIHQQIEIEKVDEEAPQNTKKLILLIRTTKKKRERREETEEEKNFREETTKELGLTDSAIHDLLNLTRKPKAEAEDDWKQRAKTNAIRILNSSEEYCEVTFFNEEEVDDVYKEEFSRFTIYHKNGKGSITFLEQVAGEEDDEGNSVMMLRGFGVMKLIKMSKKMTDLAKRALEGSGSSINARPPKEYKKWRDDEGIFDKMKKRIKNFKIGGDDDDGYHSDESEPQTAFRPYYHNLDQQHVKVSKDLGYE